MDDKPQKEDFEITNYEKRNIKKQKRRDLKKNVNSEMFTSDLLWLVFRHLEINDLKIEMLVCKSWKEEAESPAFWTDFNFYQNVSSPQTFLQAANVRQMRRFNTLKVCRIEMEKADISTVPDDLITSLQSVDQLQIRWTNLSMSQAKLLFRSIKTGNITSYYQDRTLFALSGANLKEVDVDAFKFVVDKNQRVAFFECELTQEHIDSVFHSENFTNSNVDIDKHTGTLYRVDRDVHFILYFYSPTKKMFHKLTIMTNPNPGVCPHHGKNYKGVTRRQCNNCSNFGVPPLSDGKCNTFKIVFKLSNLVPSIFFSQEVSKLRCFCKNIFL